ncbi:MAG: hypothetical protein HYX86_02325 [Chloroflexi bacterium]|nr:hypothetical protein [Chloroflexota bacterium]
MATNGLYSFPPPPSPDAAEWDGTPIGKSNTITRTKGRTAVHDKTVDAQPGKLEALLESVSRYREGHPQVKEYQYDVVIHGIRVRAHTNSPHLYDFWVDNWYSPQEWAAETGQDPPPEPQIQVYAYTEVGEEPEAAYYSRRANTIVFFNTAYYGQLKSWVLGAVGRVLAEEYGIHSVHGACVEVEEKGVLYIAPTGTGKSTSSYGMMDQPGARFHSDDWVYIRYAFPTNSGSLLAPVAIATQEGREVQGFRVFRWLEEFGDSQPRARVRGLGADNSSLEVEVGEMDLSAPPRALAYISEKVFYLRSNIVENFPLAAYELLNSKLENCPDISPKFLEEQGGLLQHLTGQLFADSSPREVKQLVSSLGKASVENLLARMMAFDNARAMLTIGNIFGREKAYLNPMQPVELKTIFLLKRDFQEQAVLESLGEEEFIMRLMVGETPDKKYETAYNAYRAVDDKEERSLIQALFGEAQEKGVAPYSLYSSRQNKPYTLYQEFELFRMLNRAAGCYHLNTILRNDPQITETQEAVRLTMEIIARTVREELQPITLTLDNYRNYVEGKPVPQAIGLSR